MSVVALSLLARQMSLKVNPAAPITGRKGVSSLHLNILIIWTHKDLRMTDGSVPGGRRDSSEDQWPPNIADEAFVPCHDTAALRLLCPPINTAELRSGAKASATQIMLFSSGASACSILEHTAGDGKSVGSRLEREE